MKKEERTDIKTSKKFIDATEYESLRKCVEDATKMTRMLNRGLLCLPHETPDGTWVIRVFEWFDDPAHPEGGLSVDLGYFCCWTTSHVRIDKAAILDAADGSTIDLWIAIDEVTGDKFVSTDRDAVELAYENMLQEEAWRRSAKKGVN